MERFLALMSAVLVLGFSAALVAGSVAINDQPAQAKHAVNNS